MRRRSFLGAGVAGAAAATLWASLRDGAAVRWDDGPAAPLQTRRLQVARGALPTGAPARLVVTLQGPGITLPIHDERLTLEHPLTERDVVLSYAHPRLVAGTWCYVARLEPAGAAPVEAALGYVLRPFVFGV